MLSRPIIATSISRVGAALGTYLLPWSLNHLGMGPTFLYAAALTAVGFGICVWGAPETKGHTLEEMQRKLGIE